MSNPMGDRNLLAGILACQKKFISRAVLIAAMNAWTKAKEKGLAQILREQKALSENQHALLEEAVYQHLSQHSNDAKKSLANLKSVDAIKQELAKIADADLQASVAQVATAPAKPKVKPAAPMLVEEVAEVAEAPKKKPVKVAPKKSAAPTAMTPARKPAGGISMLPLLVFGGIAGVLVVLIAALGIVLAVVMLRDEKPIAQVQRDEAKEPDKGSAKPPPIQDPNKGKQAPPIEPDAPIEPDPPPAQPRPPAEIAPQFVVELPRSAGRACLSADGLRVAYALPTIGSFGYRAWPAFDVGETAGIPGATTGIHPLASSPDGRKMAFTAGSREGPRVYLWDWGTMSVAMTYAFTNIAVNSAFSPDGKYLATYVIQTPKNAPPEHWLHLHEVSTGNLPSRWKLDSEPTLFGFTPDSRAIFFADKEDQAARTWTMATARVSALPFAQIAKKHFFARDFSRCAVVEGPHQLRLAFVEGQRSLGKVDTKKDVIHLYAAAFSADNRSVLVGTQETEPGAAVVPVWRGGKGRGMLVDVASGQPFSITDELDGVPDRVELAVNGIGLLQSQKLRPRLYRFPTGPGDLLAKNNPPEVRIDPKVAPAPPVVVDKGFVPLFNGKDLTGWKTPPNQPGDWRVKDGILAGAGAALDGLYTTRTDFKDYHLRMEVRVNDGGRGSIFCRGPFGPKQPELNPLLPIGFQTEICNTPKELNRTGGVSIRYMGGVTSRNYHSFLQPGEWFTLEILAEGNRVSSKINGKAAESMVDQDRIFLSGTIGLYIGRAGTVLEFRKIDIKELAPVALAPLPPKEMPGKDAAPFPVDAGFTSLFNGKDLTGWKLTGRENWRVVNGILTGAGGANLRYIATQRNDYGDFHLRMEARLNDDGNATVLFRYPYGRAEADSMRVGGYEMLLTNFAAYAHRTGTLYVHDKTGTRNLPVKERLVPPGTWFNLEVIAKGNQVDVLINGQKVNSFLNPQTHLMGGRIVLGYLNVLNRQTVMEYRKIEIKEFKAVAAPPQPPPPRPLEDFAAIFNGKDLTGWRVEGNLQGGWKVNEAGELVGQGPDTALLTKRSDYRNLVAKIELIASSDIEAYFGFRESQAPKEKVIGLTTRLTGDKVMVQAGRVGTDGTKAEVGNPRILVRAGEKFLLEVHVTRDMTRISVNGTLSTAMAYPLDAHPPGAIGLHIIKGTLRIKKFEVSAEAPGGLVAVAPPPKEAPPKEPPPVVKGGVVPLFNGKDMTGWQPHAKRPGNWRVENGILIGSAPNGGSLYSTRGDYQDFHLRAEVRINDKGFGRIFGRAAYDPTKIPFKVFGYEVLINQRPLGDKTGSLTATSPTQTSSTQAKETPAPAGEWIMLEIIARGDLVTVKVNGNVVAEFQDQKRQFARSGHIALHQDANATIEFRKVEIEDLNAPKAGAAPAPGKTFAAEFHQRYKGSWRLEGNELVQDDVKQLAYIYFGDPKWTDYDFEVQVLRIKGEDQFSLNFRRSGDRLYNLNLGAVGNTIHALGSHEPPVFRQLASIQSDQPKFEPLQRDRWYTVKVKVRGDKGEAYLDGVKLFEFKTDKHAAGAVGLGTVRTACRFKNIKVTAPNGEVVLDGLPELEAKAPPQK